MHQYRLLSLAALLFVATNANAQAYQCRTPSVSTVPQITPDGPRRDLEVTGYTLALSWSPAFCHTRQDSRSHRVQCSGDNGRFGFVVHGLWPQSASGSWPQWCEANRRPTPRQVRENMCMMPSAFLIARQWAKHGSCMARNPETYFGVTRILWESLRIPDYDRISREDDLTAGRIRQAFADANGRMWRTENVGVKLNRDGWLEEIRLCYNKRFRPTRCDRRRLGARDDARARIWRGL